MKLAVYKTSGEETGRTVELRDDVFAISPNDHAIYLDVKQFMANKRQGTHTSNHRCFVEEVGFSDRFLVTTVLN
jgi:large subunit ribosomal protein L4